jgi:EAL and modified HD-GYP domain-containing signal transduction protein
MEIGLDDLVGERLAFVNFSRESLLNCDLANLLPPSRVVIEILENVEIDDELNASVKSLVAQGYTIALDDFVYEPKWNPLLQLAKIVKLDVSCHSAEEIQKLIHVLEPFDVELLAEKVETREEHELYSEMGFTYFQGYYYSKPSVIKQDCLSDNQLAILQLVARLQDPDIQSEEAVELVSQTVSLNYKLLRYANSASIGVKTQLGSIQEAVIYLGLRKLKELASLIAMSTINTKSTELIYTGLTRAMMCEQLARSKQLPDEGQFFIVGLFSILEALLDYPIDQVLARLPLTDVITHALVNHEGVLGETLLSSMACETSDWAHMRFNGLDERSVYSAYLDAVKWMRNYSM